MLTPQILRFTIAMLCCGCAQRCEHAGAGAKPARLDPALQRAEIEPYPQGAWRQSVRALPAVRLCARGIVVSHAQSSGPMILLGTVVAPSSTPRQQALELATTLARELQRHPDHFERLAELHSSSRATAAIGGSFGVFSPVALEAKLIDALSALAPLETSRVVETATGFYILQRLPAPAEQRVSCARIAIGHSGSVRALHPRARQRSAADAEARAQQLVTALRGHPERFSQVAAAESDAPDALRGGDVGTWSSYEPGPPSVLLQTCAQLPIGAIAGPVETEAGYEVITRIPDPTRVQYSWTELFVPFAAQGRSGSVASHSKPEAAAFAEQLVQQVKLHGFDSALRERCAAPECLVKKRSAISGRGDATLEHALLATAVGRSAGQALESAFGYHVVRRDEPASETPPLPPRVAFELPQASLSPPPRAPLR